MLFTHLYISFIDNSYYINRDVCYLTMCDLQFARRTAFSYLEDLASQFYVEYGNKIQTVARPYSFIEFGKQREKQTRNFLLLLNQ